MRAHPPECLTAWYLAFLKAGEAEISYRLEATVTADSRTEQMVFQGEAKIVLVEGTDDQLKSVMATHVARLKSGSRTEKLDKALELIAGMLTDKDSAVVGAALEEIARLNMPFPRRKIYQVLDGLPCNGWRRGRTSRMRSSFSR